MGKRKNKNKNKNKRKSVLPSPAYGGWGGGGYWDKSNCHTGNLMVFEADGIEVYAGGHSRNGGWHRMTTEPCVAIGPDQVMHKFVGSGRTNIPDGWSCHAHVQRPKTHIISLDWPDFDIPQDVHREWWLAFVQDCSTLGIKTISTQCVGGHGRTGVQVAILAHLMGATKQPDAAALINWVRERYCHHAVETYAQQCYVAECCDLPPGERLFAAPSSKSTTSLTFSDPKPTKSKAKALWFVDDKADFADDFGDDLAQMDVDPSQDDTLPDGFILMQCGECFHTQWFHQSEDHSDCPDCSSPDFADVTEFIFQSDQTCVSCGEPQSAFTMDFAAGVCRVCSASDAKLTTRLDSIKCPSCKTFRDAGFFNPDTHECASCEFNERERERKKAEKDSKTKERDAEIFGTLSNTTDGLPSIQERLSSFSDEANEEA